MRCAAVLASRWFGTTVRTWPARFFGWWTFQSHSSQNHSPSSPSPSPSAVGTHDGQCTTETLPVLSPQKPHGWCHFILQPGAIHSVDMSSKRCFSFFSLRRFARFFCCFFFFFMTVAIAEGAARAGSARALGGSSTP